MDRLTAFCKNGGKLLLTHGFNDEVIFSEGTIDYYNRVKEVIGNEEELHQFLRFFLTPGDGHCHLTAAGPGISLASGMLALMDWVENGNAPDSILEEKCDMTTGEITIKKEIFPYNLK